MGAETKSVTGAYLTLYIHICFFSVLGSTLFSPHAFSLIKATFLPGHFSRSLFLLTVLSVINQALCFVAFAYLLNKTRQFIILSASVLYFSTISFHLRPL